MQYESKTLGELLDDPRISLIASDAIKNRDLRKEDTWNKTLLQPKEDGIRGDIALGLDRLYAAAETGDWYYPLYSEIEIAEDAEGFPPTALFLAADDELVSPDHSRMLASVLEKLSIPCRLEVGTEGGHGFADGSGMCMAGWPERAIRWYESLQQLCVG